MKKQGGKDEYLEFAFMNIPMAFGVLEKAPGKFIPTLAAWGDEKDDGAKIAFEMMAERVPKKTCSSPLEVRDVCNEILIRDRRVVIGVWKQGEVPLTVKCKRCAKSVPRKDTICVRDRTSLAFICINQCVAVNENELF
jgi:hypothetical protein